MSTLSDLEVYQRLSAMAEELQQLSRQSASFVGEAALQTAARSVRGVAAAVYEHVVGEDGGEEPH